MRLGSSFFFITVAFASTQERVYRSKRRECEKGPVCGHLAVEVAGNCVNECVSKDCYDEVYGDEPLEDGEVDHKRSRSFQTCFGRKRRKKRE